MAYDARKTDRPFPAISAPVYLSVGHTAHAKEHTGIQRVTRSLAREMQASGLKTEFIEWVQSKRRYVVLDESGFLLEAVEKWAVAFPPKTLLSVPTGTPHLRRRSS